MRPTAKKAKITKRTGGHTFRHTYSTRLKGNAEDVKVVQELMRELPDDDERLYEGYHDSEARRAESGRGCCHGPSRVGTSWEEKSRHIEPTYFRSIAFSLDVL